MSITLFIIIVTVIVTFAGFSNHSLVDKLVFWPRYMNQPSEYHRFVTSGFIHNDLNHLIFNMISLFCFGNNVEYLGVTGSLYLIIYLAGIVIANIPSFIKNRNDASYRSLGASGGVSTIMFLTIYFFPWSRISLMFFPLGIPAVVFGALYLVYCVVMARRGRDNINHDAHLWGSIFGLFVAFLLDPGHGLTLIEQLSNPR